MYWAAIQHVSVEQEWREVRWEDKIFHSRGLFHQNVYHTNLLTYYFGKIPTKNKLSPSILSQMQALCDVVHKITPLLPYVPGQKMVGR